MGPQGFTRHVGAQAQSFFAIFLCNCRFVARKIVNRDLASGSYPTRPASGYNFLGERPTLKIVTPTDNMKAAERLGWRTRSREFVEARTQRLLLDTLFKYGHLCVLSDHAAELIREEIGQARSADDSLTTNSAPIDTTAAQEMCLFVHHQSWLLSLFVGCPRSPVSRSAP